MAISLTYTFSPGTRILSSQVNSNFNTLATNAFDKSGDTMTGDLKFTDAAYDIGKSGATRPRDIFASRNVVVGGTLTLTSDFAINTNKFTVAASSGNTLVAGTLDVTGIASFTAAPAMAAGIQFPAAQAASANVNNLDDYEEGTWIPVIGGSGGTSGQTYVTQLGRYTKIGRMVHLECYVALSVKGTITTNVQIQGLPFTSATSFYRACAVEWEGLAATKVFVSGELGPGTTAMELLGIGAAAASSRTNLATADLNNNAGFFFTLSYSV